MVYFVDVDSLVLSTIEDTVIFFFFKQYDQETDVSNFINSEFSNYKFISHNYINYNNSNIPTYIHILICTLRCCKTELTRKRMFTWSWRPS